MNHLDIVQPVSAHWTGRYHILSMRLFMVNNSHADPRHVLENLMSMLRPGCHLQ